MKELRPYQKGPFFDSMLNLAVSQALVVMASALGKTYMVARFAREWFKRHGQRILFMVHINDALAQARDKEFKKAFEGMNVSTGTLTGQQKENLDADILFATLQSMGRRLENIPSKSFGLVIVDEAHHGCARTYRRTIGHFKPKLLLGLTATPNRMDGQNIRNIFGPEVYEYDLPKALAEGRWLAKVDYRLMVDNISNQKLRKLLRRVAKGDRKVGVGDIDRTIFLREKLDIIAREVKREQKIGNKQTIIFCRSINHANKMARYFPKARPYHSGLSQKILETRFREFSEGKLQTILVVDKFNEAIDIPHAELLVFLRVTDSMIIWLQQLGRGLRKTVNKETVVAMDYVANCRRILDIMELGVRVSGTPKDSPVVDIKTGWKISFQKEIVDIIEVLQQLKRDFHKTWEEASEAALKLNIRSRREYNKRYAEDPRLPSHPATVYVDVWKQYGKWSGFLGLKKKPVRARQDVYAKYEEASRSARNLHIQSSDEYGKRYTEDSHLPSSPKTIYFNVWKKRGGWNRFLGKSVGPRRTRKDVHRSYEEASASAQRLGIQSKEEYQRRYMEDPRLPSSPHSVYSGVWKRYGGWGAFLGKEPRRREARPAFYGTYEAASKAARRLRIRSSLEYGKCYKEDPRLPGNPNVFYAEVWQKRGGFPEFLGVKRLLRTKQWVYSTYEEASRAAQKLKIRSGRFGGGEYAKRYKEDIRLPSAPERIYADVWKQNGGWPGFLGKKRKG